MPRVSPMQAGARAHAGRARAWKLEVLDGPNVEAKGTTGVLKCARAYTAPEWMSNRMIPRFNPSSSVHGAAGRSGAFYGFRQGHAWRGGPAPITCPTLLQASSCDTLLRLRAAHPRLERPRLQDAVVISRDSLYNCQLPNGGAL